MYSPTELITSALYAFTNVLGYTQLCQYWKCFNIPRFPIFFLKQVASESPLQLLSCTWSLHIKDGWESALISYVQQPTPATLQTHNVPCGTRRRCELNIGKNICRPLFKQHTADRMNDKNEELKDLKRKKFLPASEFKSLSMSVSSLPQWEHGGGGKERMRKKKSGSGCLEEIESDFQPCCPSF